LKYFFVHYTKKLKKQTTIRIEKVTIDYFKALANETDIPVNDSFAMLILIYCHFYEIETN
jgi:hypothetical protein